MSRQYQTSKCDGCGRRRQARQIDSGQWMCRECLGELRDADPGKESSPGKWSFYCPECRVPINADSTIVGTEVRCPGCRAKVEVPTAEEASKEQVKPLQINIEWTSEKMLRWNCPRCGNANNIRATSLGTRTQCKNCKLTFELPRTLPGPKSGCLVLLVALLASIATAAWASLSA